MKNIYASAFIRRSGGILLALLLVSCSVLAGEIKLNAGKTETVFNRGNYQHFSCHVNLSAIQYRDVTTPKGTFSELFVPGYGYTNAVGDPKLPVYHQMIQLPLGATFAIQISNEQYREIDLVASGIHFPVIPAQAPVSKNVTDPDQLPFVINAATYQQNQWLGGPLVTVNRAGILRSVDLGRLDVSPVQYNPVTGQLRICEQFDVTVTFVNGDIPATIALQKKTNSPYFTGLYSLLPNYEAPDTLITSGPVTYVIVSPRMFHDSLQKLVRWKIKKGFHVIQAYTDDPTVGNTKTSIKAFLQNLYENPQPGVEPPSFVLFIGDVSEIPAWTNGGHPSDMYYCEYTGDNIPEVFYGRFSASDLTDLQPYIDKALEYEEYAMPSDAFLGEATMVAGADATNGPLYGNGQINYGTNNYFNTAHNILSHTYLQPEPAGANYSQQIRDNVSNGVMFANYTAHGSEQGWADPQFIISQIPPLQNNHKYCLMVGNCCKTSNYSVDCFAEEITRAAHKGALGYIGCSDYSYWDEDYWWAVGYKSVSTNPPYNASHLGAYDVTFHDNGEPIGEWYVTMGQMVFGGNLAVEQSNSSLKQYYWEAYCLMGDPSVSVYYSVPPAMSASYPAVVITGTGTLTVNTEAYAYVALSINDTVLLDAKTADVSGTAVLNFTPFSIPTTASLVITKQNRQPYFGTISVIPASGPYVMLSSYTIDDSIGGNNNHKADYTESIQLNVTVTNIGVATSGDVTGTLSTTDTNIVITSNQFDFGTVPSGDTVTGTDAFTLTVKDNVTDQHIALCNLELTNGSDTWNSTLNLLLNAPSLSIGNVVVLDPAPGGNNNGILDPGESATLKVRVYNEGHATAYNAISHMTVLSNSLPYILVSNPNYFLGTLHVNDIAFTFTNVITNGITPVGTPVSLDYLLTAGGSSQYSAEQQINLVIGDVPQYLMSDGTVSTCTGNFYDSGGPNGNYSDNEDYTMTFQPGSAGAQVLMTFTDFSVEEQTNCAYDWLRIYDGATTGSTLLGTYCGTDSIGTVISTNGALTFQFHSDYSVNEPGWIAGVSCLGGPLTLVANAFPPDVCLGSTSQLVAIPSGGSGTYTYQWNPSTYLDDPTSRTPVSTPEADITYTVTVNDGGNSVTSDPVTLTIHPIPPTPAITEDGSMLVSNATDGNQWYLNDAMIPGATGQTYTPVNSGVYYVVVTDTVTGCASEHSNSINILITGIDVHQGDRMVSVYPNPFRDNLTIAYELSSGSRVRITLADGFGKELQRLVDVARQSAGQYTLIFNPSQRNAGVYFLKVQTDGYSVVKKIIYTK